MFNIKDVHCKQRLHHLVLDVRDVVVFRRRCRRGHAPAIHAASYVDREKGVARFSISKHQCGSIPIVMVLCLTALWTPELCFK